MKKLYLMFLLSTCTLATLAQGPGLPGDDPDVPIDGGMYLLMAAALIYGARAIWKEKS